MTLLRFSGLYCVYFHVFSCDSIDLRWFSLTGYWWTDQLTDRYGSLKRCLWLYWDVWDFIIFIFMCFHIISCNSIDLHWFLQTGYGPTDRRTDRRTDIASYRDAYAASKKGFFITLVPFLLHVVALLKEEKLCSFLLIRFHRHFCLTHKEFRVLFVCLQLLISIGTCMFEWYFLSFFPYKKKNQKKQTAMMMTIKLRSRLDKDTSLAYLALFCFALSLFQSS